MLSPQGNRGSSLLRNENNHHGISHRIETEDCIETEEIGADRGGVALPGSLRAGRRLRNQRSSRVVRVSVHLVASALLKCCLCYPAGRPPQVGQQLAA